MLPVLSIRESILNAVRSGARFVLTAPTGSGKTTQVPQMLAGCPAVRGQIVVLEPRRLAARMTARRVALEMNSEVGGLVGYQTRFESRVSAATRIRFVTEGVFLRILQGAPTLPGVGAVVIDEFHERSIDADLALGLIKRLQETSRPDLKLAVMSATLDAGRVASYLDNAPVLSASGRVFPVTVSYLDRSPTKPVWELAAGALEQLLTAESAQDERGDVLIFMPGAFEIDRTIAACSAVAERRGEELLIVPLHGSLPPAEQDRAVEPCAQRRVIVATNVAETSITIEGVRAVIDSGTARVHRVDPKRGLNTLRVEPISRATAEQRTGRAGRVAAGHCVRLWTEKDHHQRAAYADAEIARVDLAEPTLRLKALGIGTHEQFPWFEPPAPAMVARAEACLHMLQATDASGAITELGRQMAGMPAVPRLARVLIEGARRGCPRLAARLAAVAAEKEFVIDASPTALRDALEKNDPVSDVLARERLLTQWQSGRLRDNRHRIEMHSVAARECAQAAEQLERIATAIGGSRPMHEADGGAGIACLLAGFPDHVAWRPDRQRPHCHVEGRRRVVLDNNTIVQQDGFLLALEVRETGQGDDRLATLSMVSPLPRAVVEAALPQRFSNAITVRWNGDSKAVDAIEEDRFDSIVIAATARPAKPSPAVERALVECINDRTIELEHWNDAVEQWIARVRCVAQWFPERELIAYAQDDLDVIRHEIVSGATRASEVRGRPCLDIVKNALSWSEQEFVRAMAPESVQLKRGFRMRIAYQAGAAPRGRAKIQDLYDESVTPTVAGGRVPITLEITGPNHRPLQVTSDLANFWKSLYPELRNEMRRRYPKHEWR
ncbi:MAG: ATP-dependent helicase HrpB [Phycisphaerae bacterium]|nr:ATP-dependent helicase HrpB [Phycisphaerae bacterium]